MRLTNLHELETIGNIALVATEEQTAILERLLLCDLVLIEFGTERDSTTNDATSLGRDGRVQAFQIETWIGLANMRGEWATILSLCVIRETIVEVVVPLRIGTESRVVLKWSKVDRSA